MNKLNIAIIGSGISGLSAAWLLAKNHHVTLYEADAHLGGHAHTIDVDVAEGSLPVDTGFIVYNRLNYPNLTALFDLLGVKTEPTEMSFALSLNNGAYEYAGNNVDTFFGQRKNIASPGHWRLLIDLARFFWQSQKQIVQMDKGATLGDFLNHFQYSTYFTNDHIVPMGAAIWSTPMSKILDFPAQSFIDFYANHGMLQFSKRSEWRTVSGGSRTYIQKILDDVDIDVQIGTRVQSIIRLDQEVQIKDNCGVLRPFDHVVIATHPDQALQLLDQPDPQEHDLLSAFTYQPNKAVVHFDKQWMPKHQRVWSSWNYIKKGAGTDAALCLTYWMNRLQNLDTEQDVFVTLNPTQDIHTKAVIAEFDYDHPIFTQQAMHAQQALWHLQGQKRTWYCGAYFGHGFHEDGAQSGLAVAEQLGGMIRPFELSEPNSRIQVHTLNMQEAAEWAAE